MRTTVSLSDKIHAQVTGYMDFFEAAFRHRPSFSEIVEDCIALTLPLLLERIPQRGETVDQSLARRVAKLKGHIQSPGLSEEEVLRDMREILAVQDDARNALLRQGPGKANPVKYKEVLDATLDVYNTGATRLNGGKYRKKPGE